MTIVRRSIRRKTGRPFERILGYLTWSPQDEWVSVPEVENSSGDSYVVLVSPQGDVMRESLGVNVEYNARITWTDDNHFQITALKGTFCFVVEGGRLREVAALLYTSHWPPATDRSLCLSRFARSPKSISG